MSNKVKCSHILVEKQSQALQILEEIKNGKKFGAAAKEISTCPSSKKEGDLGYFTKGMMVKEFEDIAFTLQIGEISEPVKTSISEIAINKSPNVPVPAENVGLVSYMTPSLKTLIKTALPSIYPGN